MILYVFGSIIVVIMLVFMYIRMRYKFWALQPVFHFYDLYYWFVNVGVIRNELPEKNKYVNQEKIKTIKMEEIDENILKQLILLIRLNYLRNNENKFDPKKDNIVPYFVGHNTNTFWSYFMEKEFLIDNKTGNAIEDKKPISVITSRPLHVKINNGRKDALFDVYYVDYLCVHTDFRKKNIAPQMIQTHEYNQSHYNRKISVSLFKREEELTGIIPLTIYKNYCFNMKKWCQPERLNNRINILTGDKINMYYFYNYLNETNNNWDIIIYPEISNLIELVTTQNIYIKMLVIDGNIASAYIFRKTCTFIEKEKEIISCIASIKGTLISTKEFVKGFKSSLWSIIKEHKNFGYLTIEDISCNKYIINNILLKNQPNVVSPSAYFFYNFAYSPFKSEKCLIIN